MSSIFQQYRSQKFEIQIPKPSGALILGSLLTFLGGIFVLFGFSSPYWLVSWEYTFSPFKKMGLWEFCFKDYRHPHFQFDKLFTGCHYVFSEEYRIIREWMLPGWLMTVQAFYTLGFMGSFGAQVILVFLVTRWPLKFILSAEWLLTLICCVTNGVTAFLLFLAVAIFGGQCFRRDWVQYPNFNYLSWAYVLSVLALFIHALAGLVLWAEYKEALERYREGDGHQHMQLQPAIREAEGSGTNGRESGSLAGGTPNPMPETHHHYV